MQQRNPAPSASGPHGGRQGRTVSAATSCQHTHSLMLWSPHTPRPWLQPILPGQQHRCAAGSALASSCPHLCRAFSTLTCTPVRGPVPRQPQHILTASKSASSGASTQPPSQQSLADTDDDGFVDVDGEYDEYGEYEEGEEGDGFFDDEGDGAEALGLEVDDTRPGVETSGVGWAEGALRAARKVLSTPSMSNLDLYVFRALPGNKLDIRLDRLDDTYGSPSLDDIEKFSRMLFLELDAELGAEVAADVALEVSSPGAERTLRLPEDLDRFQGLPLTVEYRDTEGKQATRVLVMTSYDEATGVTTWQLADVKANAPVKGRKLSKRQREMVIEIPVDSLAAARIYVDF